MALQIAADGFGVAIQVTGDGFDVPAPLTQQLSLGSAVLAALRGGCLAERGIAGSNRSHPIVFRLDFGSF